VVDCSPFSKGNLTLEPKDKSSEIILIVEKGAAILVNIPPDEYFNLSGFQVSHSCKIDENRYVLCLLGTCSEEMVTLHKQQEITHKLFFHGMETMKEFDKLTPDSEFINRFDLKKHQNSILCVTSGLCNISDCRFSLK